ncbi:MAG TPA: DUF4193 family protein [Acidimicrobiia bacterium]|nr:DUF4193 family protein [Acidimicrobiia bacterium]
MKDDDFDEEEEEPELDEASLDEEDLEADELDDDDDEELDGDVALEDEDEDVDEGGEENEVVVAEPAAAKTKAATGEEDEDVLDLDEELHPDDVEEPLDVLLQERTAAATLEDEEEEAEEEEPDVDERGDGPTRIMPRRPGEFLCASCFLVLPRSQLADAKRMLCRDCA